MHRYDENGFTCGGYGSGAPYLSLLNGTGLLGRDGTGLGRDGTGLGRDGGGTGRLILQTVLWRVPQP